MLKLLICKELRILFRDRRTFVVLLGLPVLFVAILGFSTGQIFTGRSQLRLNLAILNRDQGPLSQKILDEIAFDKRIQLHQVDTPAMGRELLIGNRVNAFVTIGKGFSEKAAQLVLIDVVDITRRRLRGGLRSLDIQVEAKPAEQITRAAVAVLFFTKATQVLAREIIRRLPLVEAYIEAHPPARIDLEPSPPPEVEPYFSDLMVSPSLIYQVLVPSYAVLFAYFLIPLMARSFLNESTHGTLLRLRLAPVSRLEAALGKIVPFFVISVAQGILLFLAGKVMFGMSWGNRPWLLFPIIITTAMTVVALGTLVASVAKTENQVLSYGTLLMLVLGGVSGCFMPRDWIPDFFQKVSLVTPHAWALMSYDEVLLADFPDIGRVAVHCLVLTGFSILFAAVSLLRGAWEVNPS